MESVIKRAMSGDANGSPEGTGRRYEAILRLSEALSRCQEPEDLTEILSEELREFLTVLQFYIIVYKENSTEVEWAVLGREKNQIASYADVPVQQRPSWQAYITQEPGITTSSSARRRTPRVTYRERAFEPANAR